VATAGTHPTPTKHPRAREERERAHKSATEHLQQASAEIDKARQEATADVRRSLDSALEGMRDVSGELRQRAEDHTAEWQDALEHASDKARRQMGRRRHSRPATPEALKELSDEIRKQKTKLGPPAPKGDGPKS
jgi:DNA polymerase III gamma/tau subunit